MILLVLTHPLTLSTSYVASLYLFRPKQLSNLPRDHPEVIKSRLVRITFSSITSLGLLALRYNSSGLSTLGWQGFFELLGIQINLSAVKATAAGLGIIALLFTGPLYVAKLDEEFPGQRRFSAKLWWDNLKSWVGLRNWVVAPITEELTFRSFIYASEFMSSDGGIGWGWLIFGTPTFFGIAHAHHIWEVYKQSGKTRDGLIKGLLQLLVLQFGYTTIFGWFASSLLFRTGSLYPSIATHAFCNVMGLPTLEYDIERYPHKKQNIIGTYVIGVITFTYSMVRLMHSNEFPFWPAFF